MAALRTSAGKTARYVRWSAAFYVLLIAVFTALTALATEPEAQGGNLGVLILVSLGFLGLWISPLRGLRGGGLTLARFANVFSLPLAAQLAELDEAPEPSEGAKQAAAGELLAHQAEAEREMRAWPNRLLSLAVITAVDLLMWLAWDAGLLALINQCVATVVSQAHISMAPTTSLRLFDAGRAGGDAARVPAAL
ncbi:MAG: hypothetical protein ACYC55_04760 [Candidatus Geothermincolia bacterium]